MHPLFSILSSDVKVVFTKHAQQRLVQRFKLFLRKHEQLNPLHFLRSDFDIRNVNKSQFMSPGHMNRLESRYGKNAFIVHSKYIDYRCKYDEKKGIILVLTVLKR